MLIFSCPCAAVQVVPSTDDRRDEFLVIFIGFDLRVPSSHVKYFPLLEISFLEVEFGRYFEEPVGSVVGVGLANFGLIDFEFFFIFEDVGKNRDKFFALLFNVVGNRFFRLHSNFKQLYK